MYGVESLMCKKDIKLYFFELHRLQYHISEFKKLNILCISDFIYYTQVITKHIPDFFKDM